MALARAFAEGPRPEALAAVRLAHRRRSPGGTARCYFADHPTVPIDRIVTQLNIDMIGRNRDDKPSEAQHGVSRRLRSHQLRAACGQPRRQRRAARAVDARLRVQRSERRRIAVHAERSLQLRVERHSGHLLHDRPASRLSRQHRRSLEDRVRQARAGRAVHLRDRRPAWRTSITRPVRDNRAARGEVMRRITP